MRACVPPRAVCASLVLLCAALTLAHQDKRAEMSPVPFVMGSRYGRSPERVMTPRNDRFFMGSRYGKRSGIEEEGREGLQGVWEGCEGGEGGEAPARCRRLLCRPVGAPHLYTCLRTRDLQLDRRSLPDARAGDSDE